MSEQIISPGVYQTENDQSYVPPGQADAGLAVVGPTVKGAAFVPTDITSYSEYVAAFGAGGDTYVPQTVFNYLQAGNSVKVTRVLGNGGWQYDTTNKLVAVVSSSVILAVMYPSKNENSTTSNLNNTRFSTLLPGSSSFNSLRFELSGSTTEVLKYVTASFNPADNNYITKVLGTDANYQTSSAFPYLFFGNFITSSVGVGSYANSSASLVLSTTSCTFTSSFPGGYDHAQTPWIISDGGIRLFKFHHLSDGFQSNKDIKISLSNITKYSSNSVYSTFNVLIRDAKDTDKNQSVYEQYIGVTLDPNSPNYIARAIGDRYSRYEYTTNKVIDYGNYSAISDYIRIEMDGGVDAGAVSPNVIPNGFEAVYEPIAGFGTNFLPSASMIQSNTSSIVYSGFDYANTDNVYNYLNPIPTQAGVGRNANFSIISQFDNKFTVPFQGGTDGMNYNVIKKMGANIASNGTNLFGFNLSTSTTAGSVAYNTAFNILSNTEMYRFKLLTVPGVLEQYHSAVTLLAQTMVENRTDAVYLRDLTGVDQTIATAVSTISGVDSSYSATYYPWVRVKDINSNREIYVPPSVVVPQAYAYNDKVAAEWFAPAGLNRGGLGGVIDTRIRLSKSDRDTLYASRINPIVKFQDSNVVIWGQKTLQVRETALNRINVRRLLIELRDFIGNSSRNFVFEQNTLATRDKFLAIVTPYMESVQSRQGLYAFRIQMDETLNTNDVIDRNQLVGKIYISPTKTIEFILLEFNIQPTGSTFV
jgi:hypothetical protein